MGRFANDQFVIAGRPELLTLLRSYAVLCKSFRTQSAQVQ
jgi:hypothetical protein